MRWPLSSSRASAGEGDGISSGRRARPTPLRGKSMTQSFDVVIRGGEVVDGTGSAARRADIGIRDGLIAAIEPTIDAAGSTVVDASGCIVTPGFVDVHTHYDGQVTWDEVLEPS